MQSIECTDAGSWESVGRGLADLTVRIEYPDRTPDIRYVIEVERDGVTVCEVDDDGSPYHRNATWLVPWDEITKVVVL